ncbi:hypothetical protein C0993_003828 [Termitomyces sp. T159_Od127]|nr:hypothetical protein C0993_003828 [Termitomyces sp. T159_Od127]
MPQRHYEPDSHHPHLPTERHQISPIQTKRPRIGMESPHTPTLGMYSNQPFRVPGHSPSLTQASSHGHIQAQSPYADYPSFSPPPNSQTFGSLHASTSRERATSGSDRAIGGIAGGRTVYGNLAAASSSASGRGPDFSFMGGVDDGRRRSATASSAGLDWPSSKPGHMAQPTERDRRAETEKERPVERTTSGSSGGANPATGSSANSTTGPGWLDFLSGNSTTSSGVTNTGVQSSSSPGGLSWERGSSNRTRTGGPEDGAGEIDALSLFGLSSSETKKEVG